MNFDWLEVSNLLWDWLMLMLVSFELFKTSEVNKGRLVAITLKVKQRLCETMHMTDILERWTDKLER